MNNWKRIWEKRELNQEMLSSDVFLQFCELKRVDGFDANIGGGGYFESFWNAWHEMYAELEFAMKGEHIESVFEVGCGSGVNLFMFRQRLKEVRIGGIDYSESLVKIAREVLNTEEILCDEALHVDSGKSYDIVTSDSVFQYFPDIAYGGAVLEKMYKMANRILVISEIHDLDKKEECLEYRRQIDKNYDELYQGLDKTFYPKKMFLDFADTHRCNIKFTIVKNPYYWNSRFIYNCYIYK